MRRGDWWRVGRVSLFNTRGFGLATRLADNKAEEAWIVSVHASAREAQCAEQVLSCRYGIPTTHWEVDGWVKAPDRHRSPELIAAIYAGLNLSALAARRRCCFAIIVSSGIIRSSRAGSGSTSRGGGPGSSGPATCSQRSCRSRCRPMATTSPG